MACGARVVWEGNFADREGWSGDKRHGLNAKSMVADYLTKPLVGQLFYKLRDLLLDYTILWEGCAIKMALLGKQYQKQQLFQKSYIRAHTHLLLYYRRYEWFEFEYMTRRLQK